MDFSLRWDDDKLEKALERLPTAVRDKAIRRALKLAAEPMREEMKIRAAPRGARFETPIVVNDISRGRRGEDLEGDAVVAVGPSRSFFYGFEFGTSRQAARPFARPAFDDQVYNSLRIAGEFLWAEIRKTSEAG